MTTKHVVLHLDGDAAVLFSLFSRVVLRRLRGQGKKTSQVEVASAMITAYCILHAEDIVEDLADAQERGEFLDAIHFRRIRTRQRSHSPTTSRSTGTPTVPVVEGAR